jgi:collagen type V/XI/XXIV/XXVII alpha
MRQEIDRMKKPLGTKEYPGRSCKDVHYGHPDFPDGWYWIDPNLGMPDDAIYVFCNMTAGGETCLFPDVHASKMPNIPWRKSGNSQALWYSNLRGGFRISYETVGTVQMTFLRLLSETARQNFTYTCINSAAWFSTDSQDYKYAIKIMGSNEQEFTAKRNKPTILDDTCRSRKRNGRTVFEMTQSRRLNMLPIIDFHPVDYGQPHQAFGFEVGPVCFK